MTAEGVDFLEGWVSGKLPPMPIGDNALVKSLAHRLQDDASAAGFTLADLELEASQIEQFIKETLAHIAEPGMPHD
jgi:hypothetical protein